MKKRILAVFLAVTVVFALTACGSQDSQDKKENANTESSRQEEPKEDDSKPEELEQESDGKAIEAEKNLLSVEITLPASLAGDSEATLNEQAQAAGVTEIIKNEDGSVTMKMTKDAHETLLSDFKTSIDEGINEILSDKETYPSFDSITYNDDVTQFDVNVDAASYGGMQSLVVLVFYVEGNMYQAFNAVAQDQIKTVVNFKNKDTGEVIESVDSTAMNTDPSTAQ